MKRILAILLALALTLSLAAASAEGVTLRMATGYNNAKTGLMFDAETAGEGITLADGNTYHTGELKPTWVAMEAILSEKLGTKITIDGSYYTGAGSMSKEFEVWKEKLGDVDMVPGTAAVLNEYGTNGSLVNLAEYADKLPNFMAYLEANPIVRLSITGNTDTGAIYFAPYFDGVNDIERMPLARVDWIEKLLDGEGEFTAEACNDTKDLAYGNYMPSSGKIEIETPTADGTGTQILVKDYDAFGNIMDKMGEFRTMTGVEAVNMFREYIDKTYNGYYGTQRSRLFTGVDACWDADEMVALLRCVCANPQTLNGTDTVQGIFSREENKVSRRINVFQLGAMMFGARGYESRQEYLYVGTDGELHDARQDAAAYRVVDNMNSLALEGLISADYLTKAEVNSGNYLENDSGFLSYDYNQTQTVMNDTKLQTADGEKYMAIMVPVAKWYDGTSEDGVWMRFTESWRSVKPDAWAISKAGVENNPGALDAALALIDYAYSEEGQILMSYGPAAFIKSGETFLFNGREMPVISDATKAELKEKASGNYTNYARMYLGSTLTFVKSQAFEFQCTNDIGKEGAGNISTAIGLGTIKHPELAITENKWYTSVPTVLPSTKAENDELATFSDLKTNFSSDSVLFDELIVSGIGDDTVDSLAARVTDDWFGYDYLLLKNDAWHRLLDYYATIAK